MRSSRRPVWQPLALALILALSALTLALPAQAQLAVPVPGTQASADDAAAPALPETITREEARALLSTLSDAEVRQLLLTRLDALAEAQSAPDQEATSLADLARMATLGVASSVLDAVLKLPSLGGTLKSAWAGFLEDMAPNGLRFTLLVMGVAIAGALAVEMLFRRWVRDWVENIDHPATDPSLRQTLSFLGKRLTSDIVAVVVFFIAARLIGTTLADVLAPSMLQGPEQGMRVAGYIEPIWFNLIVLPRVAAAVGRFMLAPRRPAVRIVQVQEDHAVRLYRHQIGLAVVLGLTFWAPEFLRTAGADFGQARLGFWLNLTLHLYVIWLIWAYKDSFVLMMRGPSADVTPGEAWASRAYPWFVIVSVALIWWLVEVLAGLGRFDLLQSYPHIPMILLISFAPAMDTAIRGLVRHLMPPMTGEGAVAEAAWEASRRSYIRAGRVIVFVLVVLLVARIWNLDLTNMAAAGVGAQVAGRLVEFLIILAVGYLAYELVSLWINRKLAAEYTASGYDPNNADFGGDGGGAGGSRLSTVLPLALLASRITIVVLFTLLALAALGVDTTPLLAGAGIAGLAIGFGAQKLVTDVVSGVFFLVDDAFRTGEYVEIEGTMGTVEKISIRSLQLRHHKGPVHTIPYGEIPKITNFSRDWVIMKLRFTVPFDTDPNKVKKIFKKIGQDLQETEELGPDFLQPFKSQGVLEIDDVGMVIRGKFMAKPGKQFMIRKEIYNRVSAAFAENGIDFARREVRVALPSLDHRSEADLTDEDKAAIAAAASEAAQEQLAEAPSQDQR